MIQSLKDNRIYVGLTSNLERRIKEHNEGKTKSTMAFRPWKIIYTQECDNRLLARKREKYLKSGCGKEFLKQNYKKSFDDLVWPYTLIFEQRIIKKHFF